MPNPEHVKLVLQRENWTRWRRQNSEIRPDLSGIDLAGVDLSGADLTGVDFSGTNASGAILSRANLSRARLVGSNLRSANLINADLNGADLSRAGLFVGGADLREANLRGANLREANLRDARLIQADLGGADLTRANLSGADLRNVGLSKAILSQTVLADSDLRDATGLWDCVFRGPCVLDHRTIQKSGRLPLPFLRGCGLPDRLIEYLPSLLTEAIQFFSCFMSYSTKDQEFADRLYADLQERGVRCWFAPHDIQGGRKLHEQIGEAIRIYDKLLLILSDASMSSKWVKTEIANARAREEQQGRQMLFPIALVPFERIRSWKLFDADTGIDSAREIREYFIPDFSNWEDPTSYRKVFDGLLRDLTAAVR